MISQSKTLLFGFLLLCSGLMAQQQQHFSVSCQQQPLAAVLSNLSDQYELIFAYDHDLVENVLVSLHAEQASLEEVLAGLLADAQIDFKIMQGNKVLLFPKRPSNLSISGLVRDQSTGLPLPFTTILSTDGMGTTTDEAGQFELVIPADQPIELLVQYLGFEPKKVVCVAGEELLIELVPEDITINAVTITGAAPTLSSNKLDGSLQLHANQFNQLPDFLGGTDIFRSLQLLPGVQAFDDSSADINIRSGGSDENMVLLDGITLYNINHFYGIFSAIDANSISKVTLHKNAFPAEFGGRTSGIIEMETLPLQLQNWTATAEVNPILGSINTRIPISTNMGVMVNARSTIRNVATLDFFDLIPQKDPVMPVLDAQEKWLNPGQPDFSFHDLTLKYALQVNPKTHFQATYFRSQDNFQLQFEQEYDFRRERRYVYQFYAENNDWRNNGIGLQLQQEWNNRATTSINFSTSEYVINGILNSKYIQRKVRNPIDISIDNQYLNGVAGWNFNLKNMFESPSGGQLTFGYNGVGHQVQFELDVDDRKTITSDNEGQEHSIYAQWQQSFSDQWHLNIGARATQYSLTNQLYFSPRLALNYDVSKQLYIKAAASHYNQFLRATYHEDRFGRRQEYFVLADDDRFATLNATNFMLGGNYTNHWLEIDVEFYQKNMEGILEYALLGPGFDKERNAPSRSVAYDIFEGTGYTRGMDLLLRKHSGAFQSWMAYTLSQTQNKFPQINNNSYFPAQNDRRHQLKWVNSYQWNNWNFSSTYIFASGRPFIDISQLDQKDRRTLPLEEFVTYLKDYHRLDVGANYQFSIKKYKTTLGLSIFNLLNRQNIKYVQYVFTVKDPDDNNIRGRNLVLGNELELLDRTANVSLKFEF